MKKIILGVIALGATAAFAQEAAPVETARERNNYIAFGPAYQFLSYKMEGSKAKSSDGDVTKQGAVTFDYGRYFGRSRLGVHEAGVTSHIAYGEESAGSLDSELSEFNVSGFYNYNFVVGAKTTLYLGARLGVSGFYSEYTAPAFSAEGDGRTTRLGLGFGVKQRFTDSFGMTFGLEYARYADFDLDYSGDLNRKIEVSDLSATQIKVSFAWNF